MNSKVDLHSLDSERNNWIKRISMQFCHRTIINCFLNKFCFEQIQNSQTWFCILYNKDRFYMYLHRQQSMCPIGQNHSVACIFKMKYIKPRFDVNNQYVCGKEKEKK